MMHGEANEAATYFDTAYRDYVAQNPSYKLDHYLSTLAAHLKDAQGPVKLLDIGCGRGAFLQRASVTQPEWVLFGTDIDTDGVAATEKLVPNATIRRAGANENPFHQGTFTAVTAWDVLEHVPDLQGAATNILDLLDPTGVFTFVVPVYDGIAGPLVKFLDKDPTHIHKMGRHWWIDWASQHFEVVGWHGLVRYLLPGGRYVHLTSSTFRGVTPAVLVVCRPITEDSDR